MSPILTTVIAVLQVIIANLPGAITTAEDLYALGQKLFKTIGGTEPTADDIAALEAAIDSDVAEALVPLPPPQPGDPDA